MARRSGNHPVSVHQRVQSGRSRLVCRAGSWVVGAAFGLLGSAVATVSACGFDNPQAFALGTLNWAHPNALYVRTAVWQAEDAGILPPRAQPTAPGPLAFYRAVAVMNQLGVRLADAKLAGTGSAVSIVLIPQVMWTRFEPGTEGVRVTSHADGAAAGDVVIATSEKVIRALLDGSLTSDTAEAHGLLRFYGDQIAIAALRPVMARASTSDPKPPQGNLDSESDI